MFLAAFIAAFQATCNRAEGVNSCNVFALRYVRRLHLLWVAVFVKLHNLSIVKR